MDTDLATTSRQIDPAIVERVLLAGDLRQLTAPQKISYYNRVCETLGLNPLTQPFAYLVLNGKEQLYARKECAEQLRRLHHISLQIVNTAVIDGVYIVQARATLTDGRTDDSTGAVPIDGLKGEARANAMMKAETKAKRRATLSICGLGILDESEIDTLAPQAEPIPREPAHVETLRQALRERGQASTSTVRPLDDVLPPPGTHPAAAVDAPASAVPVRIVKLLPPPSRSRARGHLLHSGSTESIPFYDAKVEQLLKGALEAGVPVLLDIQIGKDTGQPYLKNVLETDPF